MPSLTLVNGTPASAVSVRDRGLQYGHGVFETVRLVNGQSPLWPLHRARLLRGVQVLGIAVDAELLDAYWVDFLDRKAVSHTADATLKILLTAGDSARGYRAASRPGARVIFQWSERRFSAPEQVRVSFCQTRLYPSAFAGLKHCNRLEQIVAAAELAADDFEGLLCDTQGAVVEATSANFIVETGGKWQTPALDNAGVAGVMREWLLSQWPALTVQTLRPAQLLQADALYLVNSNYGVLPVHTLAHGAGLVHYEPTAEGARLQALVNTLFQTEIAGC